MENHWLALIFRYTFCRFSLLFFLVVVANYSLMALAASLALRNAKKIFSERQRFEFHFISSEFSGAFATDWVISIWFVVAVAAAVAAVSEYDSFAVAVSKCIMCY